MYYWIVHSIPVISALPVQPCPPRWSYSEPTHSSLWLVRRTHQLTDVLDRERGWSCSSEREAVSQMESRTWMNFTIMIMVMIYFPWCISWLQCPSYITEIPSYSQQVQNGRQSVLTLDHQPLVTYHWDEMSRPYITVTFDLQAWTTVHWRAVLRFLNPSSCPGLTAVCRSLCILCCFVLPSFIGHWETVTSFCSPTLLAFCSSASLWLWLDCSVLCSVEVALISLWASCKKRKVVSFIVQRQLSPLW